MRHMTGRHVPALLLLSLLAAAPQAAAGADAAQKQAAPPEAGDTMTDALTGMELNYLPDGCFQMGSPAEEPDRAEDEGPVHEVCLSGFWMGKYEVTQGEWRKAMDSNPAKFQKGERHPVEQVSWHDAQQFLAKLNEKTGRNCRLPTEAEWEYAARAGTRTVRWWGDGSSCDKAMHENDPATGENACAGQVRAMGLDSGSTAPVGSYPANAFGLHDMLGNVWEWCADLYSADYYRSSPKDNPQGPAAGTTRVFRGGSWYWKPSSLRTAHRGVVGGLPPEYKGNGLGFRIACPARR